MSALPNVVGVLQVTHKVGDRLLACNFIMVRARSPDAICRPIASMRAGLVWNDSRDMQISTIMQRLKMVIDEIQQFVLINQLARHIDLPCGVEGILA